MNEPGQPVILVAVPVMNRIKDLGRKEAAGVGMAIDRIGTVPGTAIDLPTGDPSNPYLALRTGGRGGLVIIYRRARIDENGDFVVVALMTPGQYRQQQADEQSGLLKDPVVREEIRIAAETAATIAVRAIPGSVTTTSSGGAATTVEPGGPGSGD
jgi:hypothetical protein